MKTAIKPRWILTLILAMAIASVFVLLSRWQFDSSSDSAPPAPSTTETVRPLTEVLQPLTPLLATGADQLVAVDGAFVPGSRILVQDRLHDGDEGLWVVQGFAVDGSAVDPAADPDAGTADAVIPVVLGWVETARTARALPEQSGDSTVVGRLLPPEGPRVQRPVDGQVPTLSTAALSNLWDRTAYAAFIVASEVTRDGVEIPFASGMEQVVVGPQPQETPINWLNIFYAIEWVVFAGFAFFLWWRLVADDHRRSLEDAADAEEARSAGDDVDPGEVPVTAPAAPSPEAPMRSSRTAFTRSGPAPDSESGTLP
ncbi:SURF1 family protein [Arthrobacter echini]|uniref:SURF1-like protein n=1 Tax=Arthrobacter echini TaxID=1529066 RepID=A0A4S5E2F4_9MICC|nr:SURF1 family protein [Arthrobacter echini]